MSPLASPADHFIGLNLLKENTTGISLFSHSQIITYSMWPASTMLDSSEQSPSALKFVLYGGPAEAPYVGQFRTSPSALKYVLCGGPAEAHSRFLMGYDGNS